MEFVATDAPTTIEYCCIEQNVRKDSRIAANAAVSDRTTHRSAMSAVASEHSWSVGCDCKNERTRCRVESTNDNVDPGYERWMSSGSCCWFSVSFSLLFLVSITNTLGCQSMDDIVDDIIVIILHRFEIGLASIGLFRHVGRGISIYRGMNWNSLHRDVSVFGASVRFHHKAICVKNV